MLTPPRTGQQILADASVLVVKPRRKQRLSQTEIDEIFLAADLPKFRALAHWLIVLAHSGQHKTPQGLVLPTSSATGSHLYDARLGTKVRIVADLLSAGPYAQEVTKKPTPYVPGDRICFYRIQFAWLTRVPSGPFSGDYIGFVRPEVCDSFADFDDELETVSTPVVSAPAAEVMPLPGVDDTTDVGVA